MPCTQFLVHTILCQAALDNVHDIAGLEQKSSRDVCTVARCRHAFYFL